MHRDLFRSPFPPLDLTLQEKEDLHDMAMGLLDEAQDEFENFLWKRQSTIDVARWGLLKERENVQVFVDKRPGGGTGNRDMQLMLVVGTIACTLNEVMYGELNHTTDEIRMKTFYADDTMRDGAVLSTILEPTVDQPFQSMTVRWLVKTIPLLLRAVAKHNDGTLVDATGVRELSNGDQVGCMLMHMISSSKMPPLPQYDRLHGSVRTLYRQQSSNTVQLFSLVYVEIQESFLTTMVLKSLADALLYSSDMAQTGQIKKLTSLVRRKSSIVEQNDSEGDVLDGLCSVCSSTSRSARRGLKSCCAICRRNACKRCRLQRDICVILPDRQLTSVKMQFCTPCLTSTKKLDAFPFAQEEVIDLARKANNPSAARGSATLSSSLDGLSLVSSCE